MYIIPHFWFNESDEASSLVTRFHYSRRWPSNVQLVVTAHVSGGLFGTKGPAVAAVVFSIPGTRWRYPVWELSRLVRADGLTLPLSKLVARGVKRCREMGAHLLVSFADATQGHHGGVYQACGWHYGGQREPRMDGLLVRGAFVPGRVANHRWGTQSPAKLADMGVDVVPHYDMGKHLYWKALDATGETWAHDLRLRTLAYPKPARTA